MNLKHTVYFMALVGAMAGLGCWTTQAWLADYVSSHERPWLAVGLSACLMGGFIGGLTVGFGDYWNADRVLARWIAIGIALGAVAGVIGTALYIPVDEHVIQAGGRSAAIAGRTLVWWFTGGLIGLVTGLRWAGANWLRAVHAMCGGLAGGALGGLVVTLAPAHEFAGALAYMLTGGGITVGVTLAPVLFREGVLAFVSSGDPRAQNKYASPRQEWPLHDGDRLIVGSQSASAQATIYRPEVQIYIPDAMVLPRHAVVVGAKGRFFVQPHADSVGGQGQVNAPLQVGRTSVTSPRELQHGDEILVGQTIMRFSAATRRQAARVACAVLMTTALASPARAEDRGIEFLRRPQLVECGDCPCFRLEISGAAAAAVLDTSVRSVRVTESGTPVPVIAITRARRDPAATQPDGSRRVTMLLFDTSGSMNQRLPGGETKFVTARRQVERLITELGGGDAELAIAPFDSQRVATRIRTAAFHRTVTTARATLAGLTPNRRGNTALFSAIFHALEVLSAHADSHTQVTLIVFTDGMNDVGHAADDPGLLHGSTGLTVVRDRAQQIGVTIYTVGYGTAGVAYDEPTLRALAYPPAPSADNFFAAADDTRLMAAFDTIAQKGKLAVRVLVGPMPQRREQFMGRSLVFEVETPGGRAHSPRWDGAPLGTPDWESTLTHDELSAIQLADPEGGPGLSPPLMRTLVLLTYAIVIALLWFALPRALWPERYAVRPELAPLRPERVPAAPVAFGTGPFRGAPAGQRPEVTIPPLGRPRTAGTSSAAAATIASHRSHETHHAQRPRPALD